MIRETIVILKYNPFERLQTWSVTFDNLQEMDLKNSTQEVLENKESLEKIENVFDEAVLAKKRLETMAKASAELHGESRSERNRRKRLEWWIDVFKL